MGKLVRKRIIEEVYEEPTDEVEMDDAENDDEEVEETPTVTVGLSGNKRKPRRR
jgi:hypothetical protein